MEVACKPGVSEKMNQIRKFWKGKFLTITTKIIVLCSKIISMLFSVEVYNQKMRLFVITDWNERTVAHRTLWVPQPSPAVVQREAESQGGRRSSPAPPGRLILLTQGGLEPSLRPCVRLTQLTGFSLWASHELSFAQRKELMYKSDSCLFQPYLWLFLNKWSM